MLKWQIGEVSITQIVELSTASLGPYLLPQADPGALLEVPWLRRRGFASAGVDQWEMRAAQVLSDDLTLAHRGISMGLLAQRAASGDEGVDYMSYLRPSDLDRFRDIVEELRAEESIGLAGASVAVRELGGLAGRVARTTEWGDRR